MNESMTATTETSRRKKPSSLRRRSIKSRYMAKNKESISYADGFTKAQNLLKRSGFNPQKLSELIGASVAMVNTQVNALQSENHAMNQEIQELRERIQELTAQTVTAGMRLDGKDDEKRAIEEILKHLNAGTLKEYVPNRGRMTEEARAKNNPYQYIRDNIVPILKKIGLEELAYTSIIYKNTLPSFYSRFNAYASLRRRENLSKATKPKKQKVERREYVCYPASDAMFGHGKK